MDEKNEQKTTSAALRDWTRRVRAHELMTLRELDTIADRIDAEMIELPKDADGVPIHVGDTVYLDDGRKAKVARIQLSEREHSIGFTVCGDFFALWPEDLTHERPDSLERIAEELEAWCNSVDVNGDTCEKPRDLVERIRKLAKKEGE